MSKMILKVNGKKIPLSGFPKEFMKNAIVGMVQTLKGVEQVKTVELTFSIEE